MTRPDSLFEAASYDLNKFIERRITERRAMQRDSADRRKQPPGDLSDKENPSDAGSASEQSRASH